MSTKLQQGVRRACIHNARTTADDIQKQLGLLRQGVIARDDLECVLKNAQACLTVAAGELEKTFQENVYVISQEPMPMKIHGLQEGARHV